MTKSDMRPVSGWDIALTLVLLTRLPLPRLPERVFERQAQAVWAFPLAGLVVGVLACLTGAIALAVNLPAMLSAALVLIVLVGVTGAMHEDGLADTVDGFWGGFTPERRLEIMKDSHIGTYGVLALILSLLLRWGAIVTLIGAGALWLLLAAAIWSRALMPMLMATMPNARGAGLSHRVGSPSGKAAIAGLILALSLGLLVAGSAAVVPALISGLAALGLARLALAKIGGQTGDVLGATQQIGEIAFLLTLCAAA
ncbi:adenosylcobinamide-GDP ribazoletransferase [Ruegeria sp. 2205SS24-7]|uniref:adenosylcobinamide-GDP ribazoletransferase n=1 Tax=Ruegeria discodermiae TaxID=3064389 RepID=UPI0027423833|nr:adenosylcobinamide-GDP ribazoletransferase [Ruegeria sp. 2205SS24-7]MDP5215793.1 adenosylcobinamide-GDP ribazoletransferase [Ruegeria sp. 2205SS24-7]